MIRTSDLAEKEVITLKDGRNLGPISDIELDLEQGIVEAIVVPDRVSSWAFSQGRTILLFHGIALLI